MRTFLQKGAFVYFDPILVVQIGEFSNSRRGYSFFMEPQIYDNDR